MIGSAREDQLRNRTVITASGLPLDRALMKRRDVVLELLQGVLFDVHHVPNRELLKREPAVGVGSSPMWFSV